MGYEEKIKSQQEAMRRISNNSLICKDCKFRVDDSKKIGNVSWCRRYGTKPNEVIIKNKCDGYINGPEDTSIIIK